MKLIYRVAIRLALVLLPVMALWTAVFYYGMADEINDETDDSLEDYAELVIRRQLAGQPLPPLNSGSNNSYSIMPVVADAPSMQYHDERVYIPEKREYEPARVLTVVYPDRDGLMYKLTVAMPTFEREDLLASVLGHVVALYVALMLTILLATTLIFYKSMEPLYRLLAWFDAYKPGGSVSTVPDSDVAEFHRLSLAAQMAVSRAEEYFEQQKQFIGNASHELQTPLAVIGNRIEWLIDNTPMNEEQLTELAKIQRSLSSLVRLNRTLLLLSKIDNGQFPETTDVNIVSLLRSELEDYGEIHAGRGIIYNMYAPDAFTVRMNESLASVLVTNLLKNAFLHSPDGATVTVTLADGLLTVANSGSEPLDGNRIFERFYHGGKSGSTGLGLALVSSIGRYYGLAVGYRFSGGEHIFSVRW